MSRVLATSLLLLFATAACADRALSPLPDLPSPRAGHSASLLPDGRVLLAGGCSGAGCEEGMAGDAVLVDPDRARIVAAGPLQQARIGHRAVTLDDGSVLLIGGWSGRSATASVEHFDPRSSRFATHGELLQARDAFTATRLHDGGILVIGGYSGSDMRPLASAEVYDPASGRSRAVGSLATPRRSHTATLLPDGSVLVAGGSDSRRSVTATLERFRPATAEFVPAGQLATARHKHAAVLAGDHVLLLGGATIPEASDHFTSTERWSITDGVVTPGPAMAAGRYKFLDAVVALADGRVLVFGGGRQAEALAADGTGFARVDTPVAEPLYFTTATRLRDGSVLVAGGYDTGIRPRATTWHYRPQATPRAVAAAPARRPATQP